MAFSRSRFYNNLEKFKRRKKNEVQNVVVKFFVGFVRNVVVFKYVCIIGEMAVRLIFWMAVKFELHQIDDGGFGLS